MRDHIPGYPALSERSVGWLRYLWRKATTPDSWDRAGRPHPHWHDRSDPPMLSWHRFDLVDSSYAIALMSDTTPAWREIYARILDELVWRHTGYWAARDWLEQIGPDPDPEGYPEKGYRSLIPPHLPGQYHPPGCTPNGVAPYALPIAPLPPPRNPFSNRFLPSSPT